MRILAIRGQNLASLAGPFEIDLESPPLSTSGIYAITGPTGSGKSTLLDAVCLALYDRTPRLAARGGVPIGREGEEALPAYDVRSILRRGTATGWAEVEFRGADGRRYRARWSVRRARDRADGRFQGQHLELEDLASERLLGGTKTETLAATERALGLSFAQFRRSVLLAQGDFAAFLEADARERAELLERMTGTAIYGELSKAAYRRAQEEQRALQRLEDRVSDLRTLDEAERERLCALEAEQSAALEGAAAAHEAAEAAVGWYDRCAALERSAREAEAQLADTRARWDEGEALRREVAQALAAEPHRARVEALDAARAEAQSARENLEALEAEIVTRRDAAEAAEGALEAAQAAAALAREAIDRAQPQLQAAGQLDFQLQQLARVAEGALSARQRLAADAARVEAEVEALSARISAASERYEKARRVCESDPVAGRLATQWERWERVLARYVDARRTQRSCEGQREGLEAAVAKASNAREAAQERLRRAERERDAAREVAREAERRSNKAAGEGRRTERERVSRERLALVELEHARSAATRAREDKRELVEAAEEAERQVLGGRRAGEAARAQVETLAPALAEAERALEAMRTARDLAGHRAALVEGEPCPLCGALEHPWADEGSAIGALESEQAGRVAALRQELEAARDAARAAGAQVAAWEARRQELRERLEASQARIRAARERWAAHREGISDEGLPGSPFGHNVAEVLASRVRAAELTLARLQQEMALAEGLEAEARAAREALEAAQSRLDGAQAAALEAGAQLAGAEEALRAHDGSYAASLTALGESRVELSEVLGAASGALEAEPEAEQARIGERVAAWMAAEATRRAAEAELLALRPQREAEERRLTEKTDELGERDSELQQHQEERERLQKERAALFAGRRLEVVRRELEAARELAEARAEQARLAAADAARAAGAIEARVGGARLVLVDKRRQLERCERHVGDATALLQIDEAELRRRMARGWAWVEAEQRKQRQLEGALQAQAAVVEERKERLADHRAAGAPEIEEEEARGALGGAREAVEAAREALQTTRVHLEMDREARAQAAELGPAIAEQRKLWARWRTMNDLIGSADGKKFRVFAQSLTLERLIAVANRHLGELARRYRLARVPGHDLDLMVIDHDMGDEVRGVKSLSGGESFLVSLALALGLASLSTEEAGAAGAGSVESLFIDEGFGTLDPQTLEEVLATLDALHATGRTIGLISHVPGLAERIGAQIRVVPEGGGRSRIEVI